MSRVALYFRMPRVASHSIMRLVRFRAAILPHALSPELVRHSLIQNQTAFRFTFVRHPYDRFASAWRWGQRDYSEEKFPFDPYETAAVRGRSMRNVAASLRELTTIGPALHFYPQSSYLFDGDRELVDWIGRFENLEDDFSELALKLGIKRGIVFGPNAKSETGPETGVTLPQDVRKHLDDFYSEDFERLGYVRGQERAEN